MRTLSELGRPDADMAESLFFYRFSVWLVRQKFQPQRVKIVRQKSQLELEKLFG